MQNSSGTFELTCKSWNEVHAAHATLNTINKQAACDLLCNAHSAQRRSICTLRGQCRNAASGASGYATWGARISATNDQKPENNFSVIYGLSSQSTKCLMARHLRIVNDISCEAKSAVNPRGQERRPEMDKDSA